MRVVLVIVFCFTLFFGNSVYAQQPKKFTAPLSGTVVLRDVEDKYLTRVQSLEMPEPDDDAEQKKLAEIKELIKKQFPYRTGPKQKMTSSVLAPIVDLSFIADSISGIPPDNYMSVSKDNKAVTVMNGTITVHDATTGAYTLRKALMPFSASVGLNTTFPTNHNYRYDPKVVYDPNADRYICVMLNSTNEYNWIVLGFSKSNDPTGGWNFYKFYGDYAGDTTWFDYPAISITQNEFFLTGNKLVYSGSWQTGFKKTVIYQVKKQNGYNGDSLLNYQIWDTLTYNNKNLRCLYPLNPGDGLLGPSQYFLSNRNFDLSNDSVFIVKVADTIGGPLTALTVTAVKGASGTYGAPPNGRQPDTSYTLATNDGRVLGGFIKDNEMQFVSTSVNPANGSSAIYHGVISNFNTAPVLNGRLISIDTLDFGYPNISYAGTVSGNRHSIISFEYTGPKTYPGYGAVLFDGANFSDMTIIKSGDSTIKMISQKEQRWGDYSGSQPDWNNTGATWALGIYGRPDHRYGNFMAHLQSPYKVGISIDPKKLTTTSKLFPNPSFEFVYFDFNVETEQIFKFEIYDMQGRLVEQILETDCHEGKNQVNFNIASLSSGTYLLRASGEKGEEIAIHKFERR